MKIETKYILALKNLNGFGNASIKKIGDYIISNELEIRNANDLYKAIAKVKKIHKKIKDVDEDTIQESINNAERIIDYSEKEGIKTISIYDNNYPERLKYTVTEEGKLDPPIILYYKGDISVASMPSITVIGTRKPTSEGIMAGKNFSKYFAEAGFNIVSGLAIGCDTCSHKGALEAKGITTAFLAHGLDMIYPEENKELAEDIVNAGGVLISEYPIRTGVNRYNLAARDRLQAGLSQATLVVQTGIKGGTMHAVNATLVAQKPLVVVKYSNMSSSKCEGNYFLIGTKGALAITSKNIEEIKGLIEKERPAEKQGTLFLAS